MLINTVLYSEDKEKYTEQITENTNTFAYLLGSDKTTSTLSIVSSNESTYTVLYSYVTLTDKALKQYESFPANVQEVLCFRNELQYQY